MNVEQRLVEAFRQVDDMPPAPDLWNRVVHSIEEDRAHRRRIATMAASVLGGVAVAVLTAVASIEDVSIGRRIHRPTMLAIETGVLAVLVLALGPAIRRFGRNYAADLFPGTPSLGSALLRLLDVAYALVFVGFILVSTDLDTSRFSTDLWTDQVADALARVGGLLLLMGLLHGATLVALPFVALVHNSTRRNRPLPRWVTVLLLALAGFGLMWAVPALIGILAGAA